MNNREIESLTEDAINVALEFIQNEIGVKHGDFASIYFSGAEYYKLAAIFNEYIAAELKLKEKKS